MTTKVVITLETYSNSIENFCLKLIAYYQSFFVD